MAPGSGQATAGSTVPSCGAAGPGAITVSVADVRVAVLYADAGEPSDLQLSSPTQRTLIPDATHNHSPVSVGAYGLPASLVVSIYTPYFGTTHSSTSTYAKVLAESPGVWMICFEDGVDGDYNDLVVRVWNDSCSSQSFTDFVTEPVRVRYDPRFLSSPADIDFATKALWMAQGISDRATSALSTYTTMMGAVGAGGDVPTHVDINVDCSIHLFGVVPISAPALTENQGLIKLSSSKLRATMQPYVEGRIAGITEPAAGTWWGDTIDHELFHTIQFRGIGDALPFFPGLDARYFAARDYVNIESGAQAAEDLFADVDDLVQLTQDRAEGSFLESVTSLLTKADTTLLVGENNGELPYRSAGFLEYLAERFGDTSRATLEVRLAGFLHDVYKAPERLAGLARAMREPNSSAVTSALRDFYVTLLARSTANAASLPRSLRILDETTLHGETPSYGDPIPALSWGEMTAARVETTIPSDPVELEPTSTKGVADIGFASLQPGGTSWSANVPLTSASTSQGVPRIGVDGTGNLILTYANGWLAVVARTRPSGSATWSAPVTVSATGNAFAPSLAVRGAGTAYVAWTDGGNVLYGARYDATQHAWGKQQAITPSGIWYSPAVAMSDTSAIVVASFAGASYDVRANTAAVP